MQIKRQPAGGNLTVTQNHRSESLYRHSRTQSRFGRFTALNTFSTVGPATGNSFTADASSKSQVAKGTATPQTQGWLCGKGVCVTDDKQASSCDYQPPRDGRETILGHETERGCELTKSQTQEQRHFAFGNAHLNAISSNATVGSRNSKSDTTDIQICQSAKEHLLFPRIWFSSGLTKFKHKPAQFQYSNRKWVKGKLRALFTMHLLSW